MDLNAPLYNTLRNYAEKKNIPFHIPGNKGGKAIPSKYKRNILSLDFTEISQTDNLASPNGCILKARQLAAQAFGANETFFITCGSTCAIMAIIAYTCGRGGKIITDRNCHKSVINAFALLGIEPVFVYPHYLEDRGITAGVSAVEIEKVLQENPEVCGAIITSPNYYGICSDVDAIAQVLHTNNKLLLVDEAHGAHFSFSELLPKTALECGADLVVQSSHKTIPALGQSALLHTAKGIDCEKMQDMINLFHTSSPSYIIMAYTDLARAIMQNSGEVIYKKQWNYINKLQKRLSSVGVELLNKNENANVFDHDFTRLCVKISGASGYYVAERLEHEFGIVPEMADMNNVVLVGGSGISEQNYAKLADALVQIASEGNLQKKSTIPAIFRCKKAMKLSDAYWAKKRKIPLDEAVGRVSAETITCYPPAVPIIIPGEIIQREHIEYIRATQIQLDCIMIVE